MLANAVLSAILNVVVLAGIRSESILGPWLAHAAANVATCLSVAARTAG